MFNEQIKKYLDGLREDIQVRAIKSLDEYAEKAMAAVEKFEAENPEYEIPHVGILDDQFRSRIRNYIRGNADVVGEKEMQIASEQIQKAIEAQKKA